MLNVDLYYSTLTSVKVSVSSSSDFSSSSDDVDLFLLQNFHLFLINFEFHLVLLKKVLLEYCFLLNYILYLLDLLYLHSVL